jgi:predicted MFS family arabinose efflux permease
VLQFGGTTLGAGWGLRGAAWGLAVGTVLGLVPWWMSVQQLPAQRGRERAEEISSAITA